MVVRKMAFEEEVALFAPPCNFGPKQSVLSGRSFVPNISGDVFLIFFIVLEWINVRKDIEATLFVA